MSIPTALSSVTIPPEAAMRRESPRPPHLRNDRYADQFDWDTLFYDVYRVGENIVMQGPPLFNLAAPVLSAQPLRNRYGPLFQRTRRVERINASEIWLRDSADRLTLDTTLGTFDIAVQPTEIQRFAGRRVLHTLSKDNEVRWIIDWIRYHERVHGADAVLFYDNGSSRYSASELQAELTAAFPDMVVVVVSWPFKYGPQGGMAGAVNGQEAPWDSDYCQAGSLQHARLRFLRLARSVLNADIDELVVGPESIFAAAESAPGGFVKFPGQWVTSATPRAVTLADCRHGDFLHRDLRETDSCPPKWCVVPSACDDRRHSWSVHNLFGSPANKLVSNDFSFRHFKAISNNWKGDRGDAGAFDPARFVEDAPLCKALAEAGLITAAS
jgi:hypothetical protein